MRLVIDANVAAEYVKQRDPTAGVSPGYTADPTPIFDNLRSTGDQLLLDGKHIDQEWENVIDQEWENVIGPEWLQYIKLTLNARGGIEPIEPDPRSHRAMLDELWELGLPKRSATNRGECVWYLRAAKASQDADADGFGYIVTEDADFFDPVEKRLDYVNRDRLVILESREGPVVYYLYWEEKISVHCICTYIDFHLTEGPEA